MNKKEETIWRGDDAIAFLSGSDFQDERHVVCPSCGSSYTHVKHVGTLVGRDKTEADIYDGTFQIGATESRRSAVEIVFRCEECPDLFSLVIQQHKGQNFVEIHTPVTLVTEKGE